MAVDGRIQIDTRINERGMQKGISNITNSLRGILQSIKKLGATISKVFSVGALVLFSATLSKIFTSIRESVKTLFERIGKSGELEEIQSRFAELKMAVANAFLPLIVAALPYIKLVMSWLIQMLNKVAMFVAAWTGAKQVLQIVEGSTKKVTKNTESLRKAAQGALAAFDQISVLDINKDNDINLDQPVAIVATEMVPVSQSIIDKVTEIKNKIAEIWANITETWDGISEKINKFLTWLNEKLVKIAEWIRENPEKFRTLAIIFGIVVIAVLALVAALYLLVVAASLWTTIAAIGTGVTGLFGAAMALLASPIFLIIAIIALVIAAVVALIIWWPVLEAAVKRAWETIQILWARAGEWFEENVTNPIREAFTDFWADIQSGFITVFNEIKKNIEHVLNGIIDTINNTISGIIGKFNNLTGNNSIGVQVNNTGSSSLFSGGLLSGGTIPHLATGAVIPPNAQFAAVLGDQRNGKNLETPVNLMRETFDESLAKAIQNQTVTIRFEGNLSTFIRELKPYIDAENKRIGTSLISVGSVK